MKTKKWLYWGAQFSGWSIYSGVLLFATYAQKPSDVNFALMLKLIALFTIAVSLTHLLRFIYLKFNWLEIKFTNLIPRVLLSTIVISFVFAAFYETFTNYIDNINGKHEKITSLSFLLEVTSVFIILLFWNALYFTYHFFSKSRQQELSNILLEASKNEIELKNLRSQLNPHFLFNSLNSIRALIEINPVEAKQSVTSLSNLLRRSLMNDRKDLIEISEEIEMVQSYLELEKIRFEERLNIIWKVDFSLNQFLIPPFSIQILIENAIKHGISKSISGGDITIEIAQSELNVFISVENTGQLQNTKDIGIGIENTKRRLALIFKEKANFYIQQIGDKVVSKIEFKKGN